MIDVNIDGVTNNIDLSTNLTTSAIVSQVVNKGDIITVDVNTVNDAVGLKISLLGEVEIATLGYTPTSGNSASRPVTTQVGFQYFDTDLGYPIYWNGSSYVDSTGGTV